MNDFKISECRFAAHKKMKYLSRVLFNLIPVARPGLGTFAVDKYGRMYYDPERLMAEGDDAWTLEELAGVVLHETFHIAFNHAKRFLRLVGEHPTPLECRIWNMAADCGINANLKRSHISLPDGCLYPEDFGFPGNKSAEWYYHELMKAEQKKEKDQGRKWPVGPTEEEDEPQHGPGGGGKRVPGEASSPTEGEIEGDDFSDPDGDPEGPGTEDGDPHEGDPLNPSKGEGGSASDGQDKPWEQGPPSEEEPGLDEFDIRRIQRQTAREMKESLGRGSLAGDAQAMIDTILEPKVDPLAELRAMVKYAVTCTHGYGGHTWKRRNPRQPKGMLRIPAHHQPQPEVRIIVDTSGSMGEKDLGLALGVVQKAVRHLREGVQVVAADTDIRSCQKVFKPEQVKLIGRGGTDMARAMESCMDEYPVPNVLVVVTDGETGWPRKELNAKCVAALTRPDNHYGDSVPDWMATVELEVTNGD